MTITGIASDVNAAIKTRITTAAMKPVQESREKGRIMKGKTGSYCYVDRS